MSKKLGPVQDVPPVDPLKNQAAGGLGVVPQNHVVGHQAPPPPLGPSVEAKAVVVYSVPPKIESLGRVPENVVTVAPPPPEPVFIGVVQPEKVVGAAFSSSKPAIGPARDAVIITAPKLENLKDEEPKNVVSIPPPATPLVSQPRVVSPLAKEE